MGVTALQLAHAVGVQLEQENAQLRAEAAYLKEQVSYLKEQLASLDFDLEYAKTENYDLQRELDTQERGYEPED